MNLRHATTRLMALATTLALVILASCGGDEEAAETTEMPATETPTTETPTTEAPAADEGGLVWQISHLDESGRPEGPSSIAVSPDGTTFAAGYFLTARTHRLADAELLGEFEFAHTVDDLAHTPDGAWLAGAATRGGWFLHHTTEPVEPIQLEDAGWEGRLAISPDGRTIVAGNVMDDSISRWDATDGTLLDTIERPDAEWLASLEYHPDGDIIAVADWDCVITFFDAETGAVVDLIESPDEQCRYGSVTRPFRFSPDGTMLARYVLEAWEHGVELIELATSTVVQTFPLGTEIRGITFSSDGSMLGLIAMYESRIHDTASGELLHAIDQTFGLDTNDWNTNGLFTLDDGHLLISRWDRVELWRLPGAEGLPDT